MPYLKKDARKKVDFNGGKAISDELAKLPAQDFAGAVNYLNVCLVREWIKRNRQRYWVYALIVGTLVCCIFEIYRRLIAPYEDSKIAENGDVL